MGIKGLFAHLKKFEGGQGETVNLKDLSKIIRKERGMDEMTARTIGCDTSLLIYKAVCVNDSYWLSIFANNILMLMNAGLIPVCIFDGEPPPEKDATRQERRDQVDKRNNKIDELKELLDDIADAKIKSDGSNCPKDILKRVKALLPKNVAIGELTGKIVWTEALEYLNTMLKKKEKQSCEVTSAHMNTVKNLITAMGLPSIQAAGEAEIYGSWLCCHGQLGAMWSDDGDVLCAGCSYVINKMNNNKAQLFRFKKLMDDLGITPRMFRDFCIMCGCDYNNHDNVKGFGPKACWDLIVKYKKIEDIPKYPEIPRVGNKVWKPEQLDYKNCRRLFVIPKEMDLIDTVPKEMDLEEIVDILRANNSSKSIGLFVKAYDTMAKNSQVGMNH